MWTHGLAQGVARGRARQAQPPRVCGTLARLVGTAAAYAFPPLSPPHGRDVFLLHGASGRQHDAHTATGLSSKLVLAMRSRRAAHRGLGQRCTKTSHVGGCAAVKPGVGALKKHDRAERKAGKSECYRRRFDFTFCNLVYERAVSTPSPVQLQRLNTCTIRLCKQERSSNTHGTPQWARRTAPTRFAPTLSIRRRECFNYCAE